MKQKIPEITLKNNIDIPVLGLGTWQLTGKSCEKAVRDALLLGYTHIDTADFYGNHKEIGKAIKDVNRERLFITTKVWYDDLKHDDVIKACDRALLELGIDYIDLYLVHWPNKNIGFKETFSALKELYDKGKIRAVGVSNFTINHLEEVRHVSKVPITVNQVEFHPYLYQRELLDYCRKNNITLTAYSPLARGKVFKDDAIRSIAKKHGRNPGQVALKWMIDKSIVVIPKASNFDHLKSNIEVFDIKLSKEDIRILDSLPQKRLIDPPFAEFSLSLVSLYLRARRFF